MDILQLENLDKYYGRQHVVKNLSLSIREGEFMTLLGPSGCGKTTTLRMVGGFEIPNQGKVLLRSSDITNLPPYRRPVNTVFQNYALFPNMTVAENVAFGLQSKGMDKAARARRTGEMLEMVRMEAFANRKPMELSGGQQQRVGIARAVAPDPDVLLLDEPLGALDLKLRKQMQDELKDLHKNLGKTFIYVTHDQEEALAMSDRIAVMNAGVLDQVSDAHELYYRPRTRFVADFIGEANILNVRITAADSVSVAGYSVPVLAHSLSAGAAAVIFVRPEKMCLSQQKKDPWGIPGEISDLVFVGTLRKYKIRITPSIVLTASETTFAPETWRVGDSVFVSWDMDAANIFPD